MKINFNDEVAEGTRVSAVMTRMNDSASEEGHSCDKEMERDKEEDEWSEETLLRLARLFAGLTGPGWRRGRETSWWL